MMTTNKITFDTVVRGIIAIAIIVGLVMLLKSYWQKCS